MKELLNILERRERLERHTIIAQQLFIELGVSKYTRRHLGIVANFLIKGSTDAEKLLNELGDYNNNDLKITTIFLKNYGSKK